MDDLTKVFNSEQLLSLEASLQVVKDIPNEGQGLRNFLTTNQSIGLNANQISKIEKASIKFIELSTGRAQTMTPKQFSNYLSQYSNFNLFKVNGVSPKTLGTTKEELLQGALEMIRKKI